MTILKTALKVAFWVGVFLFVITLTPLAPFFGLKIRPSFFGKAV